MGGVRNMKENYYSYILLEQLLPSLKGSVTESNKKKSINA